MTTLVGIAAGRGKNGVVLASDINRTTREWKAQGDVAYRQQTKADAQKIYVHNREDFAVCMTGVYDQAYVDFLSELLDCKDSVRTAIKEGYFKELNELNNRRFGYTIMDNENVNGLLFATRFDEPALYTAFPLGKMERRAWTSAGSGSQFAIEYLQKESLVTPNSVTLKRGIDLAIESLEAASQDLYTGGSDLVVVTRDGILEFGEQIKDEVKAAEKRVIRDIKKRL